MLYLFQSPKGNVAVPAADPSEAATMAAHFLHCAQAETALVGTAFGPATDDDDGFWPSAEDERIASEAALG